MIQDDLHRPFLVAVDVGHELLQGHVELLDLARQVGRSNPAKKGSRDLMAKLSPNSWQPRSL